MSGFSERLFDDDAAGGSNRTFPPSSRTSGQLRGFARNRLRVQEITRCSQLHHQSIRRTHPGHSSLLTPVPAINHLSARSRRAERLLSRQRPARRLRLLQPSQRPRGDPAVPGTSSRPLSPRSTTQTAKWSPPSPSPPLINFSRAFHSWGGFILPPTASPVM